MNTATGKFISIEGIEGAGKSTIMKVIQKILKQHDVKYIVTREPGGTPLAEGIRQQLLHADGEPIHESTELLLMFASRAQHVGELILPSLQSGCWVVSDRFSDASYAYQGGGRGLNKQSIIALEGIAHPGVKPDLTILLDIEPSLGMKRIAGRHQHDRIEKEDLAFFKRVQSSYLERAKEETDRFVVVNANRVLSKVKHDIIEIINQFIEAHHDQAG